MAGDPLTTKGILIGAAAVAVVLAGTRLVFDEIGNLDNPDSTAEPLIDQCWVGEIVVEVRQQPGTRWGDCGDDPKEWIGYAKVELKEELQRQYDTETGPGGTVQVETGLEADLRYTRINWSISQSAFERACYKQGTQRFTENRISNFSAEEFFASDQVEFTPDARGRPTGDIAGKIYYKVPEYLETLPEYGQDGQYVINVLPRVCKSTVAPGWTTQGWESGSDVRVPVSCTFDSHFAGGIGIGYLQSSTCPDERRYLREPDSWSREYGDVMEGEHSCEIGPRIRPYWREGDDTGSATVRWKLEKSACGLPLDVLHPADR